ncbi:MAG: hypothetical protein PF630_10705 [Gammaproteobacteria bacterium]|jgi:hypothetical protein|nr:hypothetical protein [Gammaproteobacteria bacterium]
MKILLNGMLLLIGALSVSAAFAETFIAGLLCEPAGGAQVGAHCEARVDSDLPPPGYQCFWTASGLILGESPPGSCIKEVHCPQFTHSGGTVTVTVVAPDDMADMASKGIKCFIGNP